MAAIANTIGTWLDSARARFVAELDSAMVMNGTTQFGIHDVHFQGWMRSQ